MLTYVIQLRPWPRLGHAAASDLPIHGDFLKWMRYATQDAARMLQRSDAAHSLVCVRVQYMSERENLHR